MNMLHYIGGQWAAGEGADVLCVFEPALGQPFSELRAASPLQVDLAVAAARQALPEWKTTPSAKRARYLRGFAAALDQRRAALITLQMRNNGKPRRHRHLQLLRRACREPRCTTKP
jgi:betaine-aldehyde dehydrogenase